jgi:hypothetical protein
LKINDEDVKTEKEVQNIRERVVKIGEEERKLKRYRKKRKGQVVDDGICARFD